MRSGNLALDIVEVIKLRQSPILMQYEVGLHMGQLITGIVGKARLSLSAIGTGVSQVTDIAGQAEVIQVNCSEAVYQRGGPLKNFLHQHQAGHNAEDAKNLYRLDPDFGIRDTDQLQDVILRAKTCGATFSEEDQLSSTENKLSNFSILRTFINARGLNKTLLLPLGKLL